MAKAARAKRRSSSASLVQTVSDTISSHPRMSAAVAFELGILLGQLVNQREAAFRAVKRAPASVAAAMPNMPFFGGTPKRAAPRRKSARKAGATARKPTSRRKK